MLGRVISESVSFPQQLLPVYHLYSHSASYSIRQLLFYPSPRQVIWHCQDLLFRSQLNRYGSHNPAERY